MVETHSVYGEIRNAFQVNNHLSYLSVNGRIILKWVLNAKDLMIRTEFNWLMLRFNGGILWTRQWGSGLRKRRGTSWERHYQLLEKSWLTSYRSWLSSELVRQYDLHSLRKQISQESNTLPAAVFGPYLKFRKHGNWFRILGHKTSESSFSSLPKFCLSVHTAHVLGMLVVRRVRPWGWNFFSVPSSLTQDIPLRAEEEWPKWLKSRQSVCGWLMMCPVGLHLIAVYLYG